MANIPIWPGSSSFAVGDTAFGFYDTDSDFSSDADNIATWCAQRLGYPLVDIELQAVNFFTCFEEAVTEYGHQVYTFQIVNNLFRIKGKATGSALNQIYLDDYYGSDYGGGAGSQGSGTSYNLTDTRLYSASLSVKRNQQRYNLLSQAPGFSTADLTFTGIPSPSQSLTIIATNGSSHTYTAHASSSAYHVSSSLNQFETGSSAASAATNLADLINLNTDKHFKATVSASVITLTQKIEGTAGDTTITSNFSNFTTSSFDGGASGLKFESSGSAIQAGDKQIRIKKIYHYAPSAINRYFDPYAGTGTGIQSLMQTFGFGNYSPGVNFMLMPIYFDALKLQAIEFNDQIRKSSYHFELNAGKYLKLFPIPTRDYTLWFEYTMSDTSSDPSTEEDAQGNEVSKPKNLVTDISNAPYERPTYAYINEPGRQWIRKYSLALAKEMLGSVRGKYQVVPIPGSETTLDYTRLLDEARAEKEQLITQLREDLEATTTLKQLERSTAESDQKQQSYTIDNPYQIYIH
jgi:hypothetical protein